jgi:HEAT repeat protein
MLAVLEDPRAQEAGSALAGIEKRYIAEGPKVLLPLIDRFRKLRESPDPGLRMTAVWALARTGDLDAAREVIDSLTDPDEGVVSTAVFGLKLLSRKVEGLGPEPGATPEEKAAAARRWTEWLDSVRPVSAGGPAPDPAAGTR